MDGTRFNQDSSTLLVHVSQSKAEKAVIELDIDAWPTGFGGNLTGRRFEKIILLSEDRALPRWEDWIQHLRCRLMPGGRMVNLS